MTEPMPDNVVADPRFDPTHVYITTDSNLLAYDALVLGPPAEGDMLLDISEYAYRYEDFNIVFIEELFRLSPEGKIHPVAVEGEADTFIVDEL